MKILLDECVTKRLLPLLNDHDVFTVIQQKWNGLRNGQLMTKAVEEHFDLLLTIDKNLVHQQNIGKYNLIVVVIDSPSSTIESIKEYLPSFRKQLAAFEKRNAYVISK